MTNTPTPPTDAAQIEEWFFRWIARGKAGYIGMTMEQCADMIWHHPSNPYRENNPWDENSKQSDTPTPAQPVTDKERAEALEDIIAQWPEDAWKPVQRLCRVGERMCFPVDAILNGKKIEDGKDYILWDVVERFLLSAPQSTQVVAGEKVIGCIRGLCSIVKVLLHVINVPEGGNPFVEKIAIEIAKDTVKDGEEVIALLDQKTGDNGGGKE